METPGEQKNSPFFDHHLWWILIFGLLGILTYPIFKNHAFPSASLQIKRPRLEVQKDAEAISSKIGFQKKEPIESTIFDYEYSEKTFLEYEYPLEIANQLMSQEVAVWYWDTRLVKEYDQEQFSTMISPKGELVSFERVIPNDREMKSITHEEAQTLALNHLVKQHAETAKEFKLVKDETFTKPKRKDHSFTWEDEAHDYKGAHNRFYLYVAGDQVTEYSRYLHVPEAWQRKFDTIRSYNELLGACAWLFIHVLQTAAALACLWAIVTKNIRWRLAILGGLILGAFNFMDYWNHWPAMISRYSPETAYNDFLVKLAFRSVPSLLWTTMSGAALFGGAEVFYRKLFPKGVAMEKLLTVKAWSQTNVRKAVLIGYLLVGVHLGWIVLYYIGGKNFNFWCPLGIENYQVLSDVFPFVSAVSLGVEAAFEEELACRVVGMAIGMRLFKNFWLANLFQAVVWGFAHSSYPQEPAFARGIELTVVGLLLGWVLRRFGLVACLTEHFLLDSGFSVESLLNSDVLALKISGIAAILPPLLFPLGAEIFNRLRRKPQVTKIEETTEVQAEKSAEIERAGAEEKALSEPAAEKVLDESVKENALAESATKNALAESAEQKSEQDKVVATGRVGSESAFAKDSLLSCWQRRIMTPDSLESVSVDDPSLTNEAIPFVRQEPVGLEEFVSKRYEYKPQSNKVRAILTALTAVSFFVAVSVFQMSWTRGLLDDARLAIDRTAAIAAAKEVMKKHGLAPESWMNSASCSTDTMGDEAQYIYEKVDAAPSKSTTAENARAEKATAINATADNARTESAGASQIEKLKKVKNIVSKSRHGYFWYVRFFKPLQSEEYSVTLDGQGRERSFGITREEDDPGASLSQEEARAKAERYLLDTHPEFGELVSKPVSTQKRKHRLDHTVEFRAPRFKVGEAECVINIDVIGDQVGNYRLMWDVPDSWTFERSKRTTKDEVLSHLRSFTMLVAVLAVLWWCFLLVKTGAVRWRVAALFAILYLVLQLIDSINAWPTFFQYYDTTKPLSNYITTRLVGICTSSVTSLAGIFILTALSLGALRLLAPHASLQTVLLYAIGKRHDHHSDAEHRSVSMWVDAVLLSYGWFAFMEIVGAAIRILSVLFSPKVPVESIDQIATFSTVGLPVIDILTSLFGRNMIWGLAVIIAAGLVAKYAPGALRFMILSAVLVLITYSGVRYWQEYLINVSAIILMIWYSYFFASKLIRTNYLTYILLISATLLAGYIEVIVRNTCLLFVPELFFVSLLLASPMFALSGIWLRRKFS